MSSISVGSHGHDLHAEHAHEHAHTAGFISTYVFSRDHKIIGIQFLFSTLIWFFDRRAVGAGRALAVGVALVGHADRWESCTRPRVGRSHRKRTRCSSRCTPR